MSYYPLPLQAGKPLRMDVPGRLILVDSIGVAAGIDITLVQNGTERNTIPARKNGFRQVAEFEAIIFQSSVDTQAGVFLSFDDVQLGLTDGGAVSVPDGLIVTNTAAQRVPVDIGGATINVNATNVTVDNTDAQAVPVVQKIGTQFETRVANTDAQAVPVVQKIGTQFETHVANTDAQAVPVRSQALTTIVHQAVVSVGIAATALVSDATLKKIIVRNDHATARVALGGAGVTIANGAIVLLPGDVWIEDSAAAVAWYAISDTAATNVQVTGLK